MPPCRYVLYSLAVSSYPFWPRRAHASSSATVSQPQGHLISSPAPPIRAFVGSSRDYCNGGVWVSDGHNSLVTLADFPTIASPSLSQHIFHSADKISHSLMSFRRATALRLCKCFYRDTPQAVDLDPSYSRCFPSYVLLFLLSGRFFFLTHTYKPALQLANAFPERPPKRQ